MTSPNTSSNFIPQEIAYTKTGGPLSKRKVCKTEKSFDAFVESLIEAGADFQVRNYGV